jgi:hypothetical protein
MRFHLKRGLLAVVLAGLVAAASAGVAEPNREDLQVSARLAALVIGMALFGGLVSWITKVRAGSLGPWSIGSLVGELAISAFAGAMCYLLCDAAGLDLRVTICLVGVAGHMGTRAIGAFEGFAMRKWGVLVGDGQGPLRGDTPQS